MITNGNRSDGKRKISPDLEYIPNKKKVENAIEKGKLEEMMIQSEAARAEARAEALAKARAEALAKARAEAAEDERINKIVTSGLNERYERIQRKTIEEVISSDYTTKWLLEDESKYYKVGKYLGKFDFTQSGFKSLGLYLPKEDYAIFYKDYDTNIFYEFENAVFSEGDLIGKIFKKYDNSRNSVTLSQLPDLNSHVDAPESRRLKDLTHKNEYVEEIKRFMKTKIQTYVKKKPILNRKINKYIDPVLRGYDDPFWEPQIEEYTRFYEKIVPMVQRYLENQKLNGNISSAIAKLDELQNNVQNKVETQGGNTSFTIENYMTGEYNNTIINLLSPQVAAAPVIPQVAAAPVIPQVAAAPAAVPTSWSWLPSVFKFGGKRKSKRKQRRSRKQKKSKKQRR
jgi:hypothetical protein